MKTSDLATFFKTVSRWPKTEAEIRYVAEKICLLLNAPFAALAIAQEEGVQINFRLMSLPTGRPVNVGVFGEWLKKQAEGFEKGRERVGHIRVAPTPGAEFFWMDSPAPLYLAFVPIQLEAEWFRKADQSLREIGNGESFGWILIGSKKTFTEEEDTILFTLAQTLGELGVIARLQSALQIRTQFLSLVSHEIKTPLTSIYGVLQLQERMLRIKKDEPPEAQLERQESFLKIVLRQVQRLNELIDDLLNLSRIQAGRFMVEPSEVDVAALLNEVIGARLNVRAEEAGVKLMVEAPSSLMAWVDPIRMEEVVTNLVMNAIRFSPEGGVVWIRLKEEEAALRLIVRDQGPSVAQEDRERIFLPFEKVQRTGRMGGLGLGLFITRQIAQLHGGNVSVVESVPGKGNVFEAYFPARKATLISA